MYALGDRLSCARVASILDCCPLEECNDDELREVAQALEGCSAWQDENVESLAHTYALHADGGTLLFCTSDEVLVWEGPENGLLIYPWDKEAMRRWDTQRREQDSRDLPAKKLPPKRKPSARPSGQ